MKKLAYDNFRFYLAVVSGKSLNSVYAKVSYRCDKSSFSPVIDLFEK